MRKNWRDGGKSLLKNGTIDDYAYYTCYSRAGFTLRGASGTQGIFATFSCQMSEETKKVLLSERGALALCHMAIPRWLFHYVHKKFR